MSSSSLRRSLGREINSGPAPLRKPCQFVTGQTWVGPNSPKVVCSAVVPARERITLLQSCFRHGLGIFFFFFCSLSHLISQLPYQTDFGGPILGMEKQGSERSKVTWPNPNKVSQLLIKKGRRDSNGEAPFH